VEMVGGAFCVESAQGQGTTVRVDLPLAPVKKRASKISRNKPLKCP